MDLAVATNERGSKYRLPLTFLGAKGTDGDPTLLRVSSKDEVSDLNTRSYGFIYNEDEQQSPQDYSMCQRVPDCEMKSRQIVYPNRIPSDPRQWTKNDVKTWLDHMAERHGLRGIIHDRFSMNGKALCLMNMEMFVQRVPLGGKTLYKDFQLRLYSAMYNTANSNGNS